MALFKARWFCFSISSGVFFFPNNHSMMNELWKYNTWKKMIVSFDIECSERNFELSSSTTKIELDVTMLAGSWFWWRHDHWLAMTLAAKWASRERARLTSRLAASPLARSLARSRETRFTRPNSETRFTRTNRRACLQATMTLGGGYIL